MQIMESFPSSLAVQVSAMSALAVGLGCWPEGRLQLIAAHGQVLDLVLVAMENFPEELQVQEYACSFWALLTAEGVCYLGILLNVVFPPLYSCCRDGECSCAADSGACVCCHGNTW